MNRRVRVSVVVLQEGKILLVKHTIMGNTFWTLPGGNSLAEESLAETAVREIKEETNLDVEIAKMLHLADNFFKSKVDGVKIHEIDVCFLSRITGGELKVGSEPEVSEKILFEVRFFGASELDDIVFHPPALIGELKDHFRNDFRDSGRYLGTYREVIGGSYV